MFSHFEEFGCRREKEKRHLIKGVPGAYCLSLLYLATHRLLCDASPPTIRKTSDEKG
jgi:hypothetical protein